MILPKELIYEEHNLNWFEVNNHQSVFSTIYDHLLEVPGLHPTCNDAFSRIERFLNDVMYICTDARLQDFPELALRGYVNVANEREDYCYICGPISFAKFEVVYCFICGNPTIFPGCKKLAKLIMNHILGDMPHVNFGDETYETTIIDTCLSIADNGITEEMFLPRRITKDVLESIDYNEITDDFDARCIENIVRKVGRSDAERLHVLEKIRSEVWSCHMTDDPNWLPF